MQEVENKEVNIEGNNIEPAQDLKVEVKNDDYSIESMLKNKKLSLKKPEHKDSEKEVKEADIASPEVKKEEVNNVEKKPELKKEEESEESKNKVEEVKLELQKSENARKNARDSLSKLSIKLKNYEKKIAKLIHDGSLSENDAESLLSETAHEHDEEEESKTLTPLESIIKSAGIGMEQYRKSIEDGIIDDDDLIDKKVESFDFYINECSSEESEEVIKTLVKFLDKPVILAKKMLAIGEKYYEDGYKDFHESGGFLKYKKKQSLEKEKLQKEVDKLNKEVLRYKEQYENFVEPKTMKLPSGGSQSHKLETLDTSISGIISRRKTGLHT